MPLSDCIVGSLASCCGAVWMCTGDPKQTSDVWYDAVATYLVTLPTAALEYQWVNVTVTR